MGKRSDLRLIKQAMDQRWDIRPEYKAALPRILMQIAADPANSNRDRMMATKILLAAEAQNQADEHDIAEVEFNGNRFSSIAERLGISTTIERVPEESQDTDSDATSSEENDAE